MDVKNLSVSARRTRVFELYISGRSVTEIASEVGKTSRTVYRDLHAYVKKQADDNAEHIAEYREAHAARYEALISAWWSAALDPDSKAGDKVLRAMERLENLQGLIRPVPKDDDIGDGSLTVVFNPTRYEPASNS